MWAWLAERQNAILASTAQLEALAASGSSEENWGGLAAKQHKVLGAISALESKLGVSAKG
jgi:hypothetical protein